jgi:hypothetical protein
MSIEAVEQRVDALRKAIVALVGRDGSDLTARQMGVFRAWVTLGTWRLRTFPPRWTSAITACFLVGGS